MGQGSVGFGVWEEQVCECRLGFRVGYRVARRKVMFRKLADPGGRGSGWSC